MNKMKKIETYMVTLEARRSYFTTIKIIKINYNLCIESTITHKNSWIKRKNIDMYVIVIGQIYVLLFNYTKISF